MNLFHLCRGFHYRLGVSLFCWSVFVYYPEFDLSNTVMLVEASRRVPQHAMTNDPAKVWPKGVVPYQIHRYLHVDGKRVLSQVMKAVEANTCIKFKNASALIEREFTRGPIVLFGRVGREGDDTPVGYDARKPMIPVQIDELSGFKSALQAVFHLLGRYNEHQRPDRDNHVEILWQNIRSEFSRKFSIRNASTSQSLRYDFRSVMHFHYNEFAHFYWLPTISPKDLRLRDRQAEVLGNSLNGTELDFLHIRLLYCEATKELITNVRTYSAKKYIYVVWKHPVKRPEEYRVRYSCRLKRGGPNYSSNKGESHSFRVPVLKVTSLRPGSICKVSLTAIYNPATLDKGIQIYGTTLDEEQRKLTDFYEIDPHNKLGTGCCGVVYTGRSNQTGETVAIKEVDKLCMRVWDDVDGQHLPREVTMLKRLHHKNVIRIYDYFEDDNKFYIVLEKPEQSIELYKYVKRNHPLCEDFARYVFAQIVEAVEYCFSQHVVHRDIKTSNILLDLTNGEIKLIDFGFSMFDYEYQHGPSAGTRTFMPPEWIRGRKFEPIPGTVWSLGVILFNILQGKIPFLSSAQVIAANPFYSRVVSKDAMALTEWMLRRDPLARPTLREILEHPWMQGPRGL